MSPVMTTVSGGPGWFDPGTGLPATGRVTLELVQEVTTAHVILAAIAKTFNLVAGNIDPASNTIAALDGSLAQYRVTERIDNARNPDPYIVTASNGVLDLSIAPRSPANSPAVPTYMTQQGTLALISASGGFGNAVLLTGDQTINGSKTFLETPVVPTGPGSLVKTDSNNLVPAGQLGTGSFGAPSLWLRSDRVWANLPTPNPYARYYQPSGGDDGGNMYNLRQAAVSDAIARGDGLAEIWNAPGLYTANTPIIGGPDQGAAMVPLGVAPVGANKVTLNFLCSNYDAAALEHWNQTAVQKQGAVWQSTYAGGASLPAVGEISIFGGPTPHYGYGDSNALFSNYHFSIQGFEFLVPQDAQVCGVDLRGIAQARIGSCAVLAGSISGHPPVSGGQWAFGVAMPYDGNNAKATIDGLAMAGLCYGLIVYEHVNLNDFLAVNCVGGIVPWSNSSFPHWNTVEQARIEGCYHAIYCGGSSTNKLKGFIDIEPGSSHVIHDPNDTLYTGPGLYVGSNGNGGDGVARILNDPTTGVNGAHRARIYNADAAPGWADTTQWPNSIPSIGSMGTGVQLRNTFWVDSWLNVSGPGITGIKTGAFTTAMQSTGLVPGSGTARVPVRSGGYVELDGSMAGAAWSWEIM